MILETTTSKAQGTNTVRFYKIRAKDRSIHFAYGKSEDWKVKELFPTVNYYEIEAYNLERFLNLYHVPTTVEREIGSDKVILTYALVDTKTFATLGINTIPREVGLAHFLLGDRDLNLGNVLKDQWGNIFSIDFSASGNHASAEVKDKMNHYLVHEWEDTLRKYWRNANDQEIDEGISKKARRWTSRFTTQAKLEALEFMEKIFERMKRANNFTFYDRGGTFPMASNCKLKWAFLDKDEQLFSLRVELTSRENNEEDRSFNFRFSKSQIIPGMSDIGVVLKSENGHIEISEFSQSIIAGFHLDMPKRKTNIPLLKPKKIRHYFNCTAEEAD